MVIKAAISPHHGWPVLVPGGQGALKGLLSFLYGSGSHSPFTWSHQFVSCGHPCLVPELPGFLVPSSPISPRPEQTRPHSAFCPRAWMVNEQPFCPWLYKAICAWAEAALDRGLGWRQGEHNPILPGWLIDRSYMQAEGTAQAGTVAPGAAQEEKGLLLWWAIPRGFTAKCLCHSP